MRELATLAYGTLADRAVSRADLDTWVADGSLPNVEAMPDPVADEEPSLPRSAVLGDLDAAGGEIG